jgi:flagellar motor switch protein FliN/FliY
MSSISLEAVAAVAAVAAGATQPIALPELDAGAGTGSALLTPSNALLDSIDVTLSVVVGQSRTTLGELLRLKEADLLTIDRKADYPVDVVVNGNVVARGQLVVIDDAFGVRVTEVAAAARA